MWKYIQSKKTKQKSYKCTRVHSLENNFLVVIGSLFNSHQSGLGAVTSMVQRVKGPLLATRLCSKCCLEENFSGCYFVFIWIPFWAYFLLSCCAVMSF